MLGFRWRGGKAIDFALYGLETMGFYKLIDTSFKDVLVPPRNLLVFLPQHYYLLKSTKVMGIISFEHFVVINFSRFRIVY